MKSSLILFCCCLFSLVGIGQRTAPGYMGKRHVLKYDQGISWDFSSGNKSPIPFLFHTLQFDKAITKKTSFGVEYSFMYRKYKNVYTDIVQYDNNSRNDYRFKLNRSFSNKVGVYMKLFSQRNGHIAPAGPYMTVGLNIHLLLTNYNTIQKTYNSGGSLLSTTTTNSNRMFFDFAPHIGGGKQYIVSNKFVLDVSMRISIPTLGLFQGAIFGNPTTVNYIGGPIDDAERTAVRYHAMLINSCAHIVEFRLGFGGVL